MSDKLAGGVKAGTVDFSTVFVLRKTADNTETTGKVAADMTGSYLRQGGVRVAISLSDLAAVNSAHSDGGVKEVDSTNQPGLYRLDLPDAAVATGADWVTVSIKVASSYVFHERFALETVGAAEVKADTAAILVDTGTTLDGRIPAALVSGRIDASVGAMAAGTVTAAAVATDAIDADAIAASAVTEIQAGLSTLDAAGVRTAVGLASANLDTQLTTIDDFLDTEVAAIKAKTDGLPSDPADASDVAAAVAAAQAAILAKLPAALTVDGNIKADTLRVGGTLQTAGDLAALAATIAAYIDTEVAAILAAVDTEVAAIKAKTDNLPASPAAVGSAMTLDPTQSITLDAGGAATLKQILSAAWGQGYGKWAIVGTTLTIYGPDGAAALKAFTLDSATAPTSRTPA